MSRRVRFQPEAEAELREAARWYENRRTGFGFALLAAVDDAVEAVVDWPGMGAPVAEVDGQVLRQIRVRRYPYHVGYTATDNEVLVLAVAHDRRRPGYWTDRR